MKQENLTEEYFMPGDWIEIANKILKERGAVLVLGVIEFIANDIDELIEIIDGVRVTTASETRVLKTKGLEITSVKMSYKDLFLHSLTNPNIAYILLFLGIYGILGEFSNPGSFFPGIVGGISLILALGNIKEPKIREVTPPAVRSPKVGVYTSITRSTIPKMISRSPP
ncbi:unnamed protein product [marine sediment metagenome]|uniref:NfeD integral membrane domain-containing protein n=1 Tax=marine sediment metagenome TaxID=412755 RepID=X1F0I8_9ZZZZ